MIKYILFLLITFTCKISFAKTDIFRGKENQATIQGAIDIDDYKINHEVRQIGFRYSQRGTFFKLDTRDNIEVGSFLDFRDDTLNNKMIGMAGISKDLVFGNDKIYFTAGLGAYVKSDTGQVNSIFMFGERISVGTHINDRTAVELYAMHFSNAYLREPNDGYNFIGLSISYNF